MCISLQTCLFCPSGSHVCITQSYTHGHGPILRGRGWVLCVPVFCMELLLLGLHLLMMVECCTSLRVVEECVCCSLFHERVHRCNRAIDVAAAFQRREHGGAAIFWLHERRTPSRVMHRSVFFLFFFFIFFTVHDPHRPQPRSQRGGATTDHTHTTTLFSIPWRWGSRRMARRSRPMQAHP